MDNFKNVEVIRTALAEALSSPSEQTTKIYLQQVWGALDNYLNSLNNFYYQIEAQSRPIIDQYESANADKNTISYAVFKHLNYVDGEVEHLLKEGYILMDEIRHFFTGETITYQIGIPYRGTLYEQSITLEELLKYTKIDFNTKSKIDNIFKLRMTNKKGMREAFQENSSIVKTSVQDGSTVYSAVWHYINSPGADPRNKNLGNAYEVYRVLIAKRQNSNKIPPEVTVEMIESAFTEVRSNVASSIKGGDFLTSQIKYFASAPSLATTSLIRTTLQDVRDMFKNFLSTSNISSFKQSIKEMFLKDVSLVDNLEKDAVILAEEKIDQIFANLKID